MENVGGAMGEGGAGGDGGSACPEGGTAPLADTFGEVTVVEEIDDMTSRADDPFFSDDLLELYFNSNREGEPFQIYRSTRACPTDPWGEPVKVEPLDLGIEATTPALSPDGLTLFVSYSDEMPRDFDIFMSTRASKGMAWATPIPVTELSSLTDDRVNWIRADGLEIGIDSKRDGSGDLFTASRADTADAWSNITAIADVNDPALDESEAWRSPDGLTMYFAREGQIHRAARASAGATWMVEAVDELNVGGGSDPWLSPDGRYIMFTRSVDGRSVIHQASR